MEMIYYQLVKANRKDPTKGRPITQVPTHLRAAVQALLDADEAQTTESTDA